MSPEPITNDHEAPDIVITGEPDELQFVVGIGASAGGLNSIEKLLQRVSSGDRAAIVIIQHISPDIVSSMADILSRSTSMPIETIRHNEPIRPNHVYLIPPGEEVRIEGAQFVTNLLDRTAVTKVIDRFFESLAEAFRHQSIGIILSGSGTDGREGVKAVQQAGGMCIVESFETAQFDSMPKTCMSTGFVNHVLPPHEIGDWLTKQFRDPSNRPVPDTNLNPEALTGIDLIFSQLTKRHDVDFSQYKASTVARRIERRQQMCQGKSILEYAEFARDNLEELDLLYHDLLIGVTKFFRDTEAFETLDHSVHELVENLPDGDILRVWCAGCASGEEAYSLAMSIHDAFERADREPKYKVFATDIHKGMLDFASTGIYSAETMEFVSESRKQRYFALESDFQFRVKSDLRKHLVFARHNVFKDPPFTRMSLVTCRNLLIYLKQEAQFRAISSFHFSLKIDGLLFMGASESLGAMEDEFKKVDPNWRLFQKIRNLPSLLGEHLNQREFAMRNGPRRLVNILNSDKPESLSFTKLVECYDLILEQYISSGLLLDDQRNILHVFGNASQYLVSKKGRFSGSLSDFLAGDAKVSIMAALIRSSKQMGETILLEDLEIEVGDGTAITDVEVLALAGNKAGSWIWCVKFRGSPEDRPRHDNRQKLQHTGKEFSEIESELIYTKDSLNATIEELEASNEELQAANEELVASNEELQSTNEELQSVNEELYTVNLENNRKIDELQELTDDLEVLLSTSEVGTLFLDTNLVIRKFTRSITEHFDLMNHDIGRPLDNFSNRLNIEGLQDKLTTVLDTQQPYETELVDASGTPILLKLIVHLSGGRVTGVILNIIKRNRAG